MLVVGADATLTQMIALADLSVAMMTLVNVTAIILLTKVIVKVTNDYHQQMREGKLPTFEVEEQQANEMNLSKGVWRKS